MTVRTCIPLSKLSFVGTTSAKASNFLVKINFIMNEKFQSMVVGTK